MKNLFLVAIAPFIVLSSAYGCGCTDAPVAHDVSQQIIEEFHKKDLELTEELKKLGKTLAESYTLQNQAALDEERIARLKKAQAEVLEKIAFDQEKLADLTAKGNEINAKNAELNLIRLEQAGIYKSTLLEKRGN